jgi:predicted kinase
MENKTEQKGSPSKILILQGPPASGKSTYAKSLVAKDSSKYVIVCRDDFRECTGEYNMKHEDYITVLEDTAVRTALKQGLVPIIDATNLNPKYLGRWQTMADECGATIEYKEFYIPFAEAVERDKKRGEQGGRSVGVSVLKRFYSNYYHDKYLEETGKFVNHKVVDYNYGLRDTVVFDIDGTTAWMQGRNPYDVKRVKEDIPDVRVIRLIKFFLNNGMCVHFLSGREGTEQCRKDTYEWLRNALGLRQHDEECFTIHMRTAGDRRPDEVIKRELYESILQNKYNVLAVFDDRNKVVNMWRELGILCCQVNDGDF